MKKFLILIIIVVIIISAIIIGHLVTRPKTGNQVKETPKSYIYTDVDKEITINGKKEYDLEQNTNNTDCMIDLSDKNSFRLLVSKIDDVESKALNVVANADKELYVKNYNEVTEISETTTGMIDNKESYSYSFNFVDTTSTKSLVMNVHYVRVGDKTYVIDIIHLSESENDYTEEIEYLLSNMKIGTGAITTE